MSKVIIKDYDDWVEVFADGKLIYEGHQPCLAHKYSGVAILEALGHEVEAIFYTTDDDFN